MRDNNVRVRNCFGFWDALGIAFIVLKLVGVISWPWIWVLAPIWIPIAIALVAMLIACIALFITNRN